MVQQVDQVVESIREREYALERAALRAETHTLAGICSEDFLFTHGNGLVQTREEWIAAIATNPDYRFTDRTLSDLKVEVHGDVVITSGRLDVTFTTGRHNAVRYVRVYALRLDEWRLLSHRTVEVIPLTA